MPPASKLPESERKLVGNLTVADARHLLRCEGGNLTPRQIAYELTCVALVAGFTARAIVLGNATAWHLLLPTIAQYGALILALPPIYLVLRHPGLRHDAIGSLYLVLAIVIVLVNAVLMRAHDAVVPWRQQLATDAVAAWHWMTDAEMDWPIAIAALSMLASLPNRVHNLYKFGPPFAGVSLGCGMRFLVLLAGLLALPFAIGNAKRAAWILWTLFLIAETCTFAMLWDVQQNLKRVDAMTR